MNIFALSKNPVEAAQQMLDKHVVKMPTETCQMLHTNHLYFAFLDLYGYEPSLKELKQYHKDFGSNLMKPAMLNHPSTIWARKTMHNAKWLYEHGLALCEEYTYRYGKRHGTHDRILNLQNFYIESACSSKATPVDIAMDDKYRLDINEYSQKNPNWTDWDFVIDSYKHYYLEGKWRFAEWRKNRRPDWFPKNQYAIKYNEEVDRYNRIHGANFKRMVI